MVFLNNDSVKTPHTRTLLTQGIDQHISLSQVREDVYIIVLQNLNLSVLPQVQISLIEDVPKNPMISENLSMLCGLENKKGH